MSVPLVAIPAVEVSVTGCVPVRLAMVTPFEATAIVEPVDPAPTATAHDLRIEVYVIGCPMPVPAM